MLKRSEGSEQKNGRLHPIALVVGGAGAPAYADVLERIGARTGSNLADFRVVLAGLRAAARPNAR